MSLHDDLLAQAQHLVGREARRPKQASLRRAVSAAYYALFHLLIHEASARLVKGNVFRQLVSRAFIHAEMRKASKAFAGGTLPNWLAPAVGSAPLPRPLKDVAQAFVDLQQARHEADYDLAKRFTRCEAQALLRQVAQAFQDWQSVRKDVAAVAYLTALLLWDRIERAFR